MEKKEEAMDVCLAIRQMEERAAEKERISTLLQSIEKLIENAGWSAEHAMDMLAVSEHDRREIKQLLQ